VTEVSSGVVNALSVQSDNKVIVGGSFSAFDGNSSNNICRLNSDGSYDSTFTTGTGFDGPVNAVLVRADGTIVVGGDFTEYDGNLVSRIALLNSDGSWNEDFTLNDGLGLNGPVHSLALQADGKIVVGGSFSTSDFSSAYSITRLNADGSADVAFDLVTGSGFTGPVYSVAIQADGKIVVGGDFLEFNETTANRVARLNTDGSLDTDFSTAIGSGADRDVFGVLVQPSQKLSIVGNFLTFQGTSVNRIVRLNSDGTRDTAFSANVGSGFDGFVTTIVSDSSGRLIAGGSFKQLNGAKANQVARMSVEGVPDTAFNTNIDRGANSVVFSLAPRSSGDLFIGGDFNSFNYQGWVNFSIRRRFDNGTWRTV
jgi:uncharacterized delta-60 repeat protein